MRTIKYILYSILGLVSIVIILIFIKSSFTWAFDNEVIYSITNPEKNYSYELYFTEGGGATDASGYVLRKTYNFFSYSKVLEVFDARYVYFNDMQFFNDRILVIFRTGNPQNKLDSIYVMIE